MARTTEPGFINHSARGVVRSERGPGSGEMAAKLLSAGRSCLTAHGVWRGLAIATLLILQGCATAPLNYVLQSRWDPAQFESYRDPGKGTVAGTAFLKTRGGEIRLGAGNSVMLMPVATYSLEYMKVRVLGSPRNLHVTNISPELARYVREQTADVNGQFRFGRVPPGDYFVACYISWDVSATQDTGAWGVGVAHVDSSETVEVVVTDRDRSTMADIIRTKVVSSAMSGAPHGARYRVTLQGDEVVWASAIRPRGGGWLSISLPGGQTRTVEKSKVVQILDTSGKDLTADVIYEGKQVGR